MKKKIKTILLSLLAVLVIIQFFQIDKTNPPLDASKDFITIQNPPQEVASLLQDACYDCHSHLSEYPWYTNVQPLAWWMKHHIDDGRRHLNFSTWADYNIKKKADKAEDLVDVVREGEMPLTSFTWTHPEARLTNLQRKKMTDWLKTVETNLKKELSTRPRLKQAEGEVE